MGKRQILVLSHGGVAGKTPFSRIMDMGAVCKAKEAIGRLRLAFDLVLGAPCIIVQHTADELARGVELRPLKMLNESGAQMQKVKPFFDDLGMLPNPEAICSHALVHSMDSLAEAVGWEVDTLIGEKNPKSTLVIVFPPITQLLISYLRCGEHGGSPSFKEIVLADKFGSCEGYLLQDMHEGKQWMGGVDSRFPPHS